tara:strand:- start:18 stop:311 length:294 start_codon:yes stop_codon:yes gene_type:complete
VRSRIEILGSNHLKINLFLFLSSVEFSRLIISIPDDFINIFKNIVIRLVAIDIVIVKVTINNLEIFQRSEDEIIITTNRKLNIEDQKLILSTSQNGF